MVIFGWGRRERVRPLDETRHLILNYGYFHLFWLFTVTFKYRYMLATWTESGWVTREVPEYEAAAMHDGSAPKPAWWWRWSLLFLFGASMISGIINSVTAN